ncbi:cysteate racemase [Oceanobacillus sp. CAU 1775]
MLQFGTVRIIIRKGLKLLALTMLLSKAFGGVNMNYKLGVIGGMGPLATMIFYKRIIKHTLANKDQDHIDMMILNHATMPDRTRAILEKKEKVFLETVKKDIELMETAGVANIAIPCNTSHYFYKEMQQMTNINIINMIEETASFAYNQYGENSKVGILATDGTISTNVYKNTFKEARLNPIHPDQETQGKVMDIIYSIKSDVNYNPEVLNSIISDFIGKENLDCVILGCTELSTVPINEEIKQYCIDPLNILVQKSIQLSGKNMI